MKQPQFATVCHFKYRSPSAALRCLTEGTLYFAKPCELNDTLEARYDHDTHENFVRTVTKTLSEVSQQRGGPALEFDSQRMQEMADAYLRECQYLHDFTERIGIFSAAQRPDNQAMWAYYAADLSGICFELEWSHEVIARYQLFATDVQYQEDARVHNRADDWRSIFLELAAEHPEASLQALQRLTLEDSFRRKWGCYTAVRAASIKHTDWAHEKEKRLLAPQFGALPVLGAVLRRVHFLCVDGQRGAVRADDQADRGKVMQCLHADYPSVELIQWKFAHGSLSAKPTPMEFRLSPI